MDLEPSLKQVVSYNKKIYKIGTYFQKLGKEIHFFKNISNKLHY